MATTRIYFFPRTISFQALAEIPSFPRRVQLSKVLVRAERICPTQGGKLCILTVAVNALRGNMFSLIRGVR